MHGVHKRVRSVSRSRCSGSVTLANERTAGWHRSLHYSPLSTNPFLAAKPTTQMEVALLYHHTMHSSIGCSHLIRLYCHIRTPAPDNACSDHRNASGRITCRVTQNVKEKLQPVTANAKQIFTCSRLWKCENSDNQSISEKATDLMARCCLPSAVCHVRCLESSATVRQATHHPLSGVVVRRA